jgi:hypothetical protein
VLEEGWYVDPSGSHEARWISDGTPTALVRDGQIESKDPPPDTPYLATLQQLPDVSPPDGSDLLRADEGESETIQHRQGRELSDLFDQIGWPGSNGPSISHASHWARSLAAADPTVRDTPSTSCYSEPCGWMVSPRASISTSCLIRLALVSSFFAVLMR